MMKVVDIGDKISLVRIERHNVKASDKKHSSQLLDFVEQDKAIISVPMENGRVVPLSVGTKYEACFVTHKGLYKCDVEVVDRFKEGNMFQMLIKFLTAFEKYQRREYFRLEILMSFKCRLVPPEEEILIMKISQDNFSSDEEKQRYINTLESIQGKWNKANCIDLSGGGMRFTCEAERTNQSQMIAELNLEIGNQTERLEIPARIISYRKLNGNAFGYEYRIMFTDISKGDREKIIRFIFEEERRRRRKEKNYG